VASEPGYTDPARRSGRPRGDHAPGSPLELATRLRNRCTIRPTARASRVATEPGPSTWLAAGPNSRSHARVLLPRSPLRLAARPWNRVHPPGSLFVSAVRQDGRVQPPGSPLGLATQPRKWIHPHGSPRGSAMRRHDPVHPPVARAGHAATNEATHLASRWSYPCGTAPRAPIRLVARAGLVPRSRGPPTWLGARPNPWGHGTECTRSGSSSWPRHYGTQSTYPSRRATLAARGAMTQVHSLARSTRPAQPRRAYPGSAVRDPPHLRRPCSGCPVGPSRSAQPARRLGPPSSPTPTRPHRPGSPATPRRTSHPPPTPAKHRKRRPERHKPQLRATCEPREQPNRANGTRVHSGPRTSTAARPHSIPPPPRPTRKQTLRTHSPNNSVSMSESIQKQV
jgi:hypothetical protein